MSIYDGMAGQRGHPDQAPVTQAVGGVRPDFATIYDQGETMNDPTRADHAKAEVPARRVSLSEAIDALSRALTNPLVHRLVADELGSRLDGQGVEHVIATVRLLEVSARLQQLTDGPGYLEQLRQQGLAAPPTPPTASGFPPPGPSYTPRLDGAPESVPPLTSMPRVEQDGRAGQ